METETQQKQVSKLRKLNPRKLVPPPEVVKMQKGRLPKNKLIKFFVLFFGEGL